jgi:hypothetical protein
LKSLINVYIGKGQELDNIKEIFDPMHLFKLGLGMDPKPQFLSNFLNLRKLEIKNIR